MSVREKKRLAVLNEVEKGRMVVREAAEVLGISERQGWRLLAAYREEGAAGLAHGNRGRKPVQVLAEEIRDRVVELAREKYVGVNHTRLAIYHDRHGIFERSALEGAGTMEEQLLGEEPTTQFGRLLKELEIESIAARSPQAKGRVERLFGTIQDRLVSELRLAGAQTHPQGGQSGAQNVSAAV